MVTYIYYQMQGNTIMQEWETASSPDLGQKHSN
jgi:hypothetical protein